MLFRLLPASEPAAAFAGWIEFAIRAIEGLAVAIIALSVLVFTLRYLYLHARPARAQRRSVHAI